MKRLYFGHRSSSQAQTVRARPTVTAPRRSHVVRCRPAAGPPAQPSGGRRVGFKLAKAAPHNHDGSAASESSAQCREAPGGAAGHDSCMTVWRAYLDPLL